MGYPKEDLECHAAKPSETTCNNVVPRGSRGGDWVMVDCGPHGFRPRRQVHDLLEPLRL